MPPKSQDSKIQEVWKRTYK